MADCDDTLRELYTYLDGEIPTAAQSAIEAHLDGCMDCLQVYDFQAELRVVIAAKARVSEVPPSLLRRLHDCLGITDPGGRFPNSGPRLGD